jgi:outer membrane murein-binding lipoprotein Lpp
MRYLQSRVALAGLMIGALTLGGCATVESVEHAQSSADAAAAAAQHAQGSADAAGSAAQAANAAAEKAQAAADAAGTSAQGASTDAARANQRLDALEKKVSWLERQKKWRKAHGKKGTWKKGKKC